MQFPDLGQFELDEFQLAELSVTLGLKPCDLLFQLADTELELLSPTLIVRLVVLEQPQLSICRVLGFVTLRDEVRRQLEGCAALAFGGEPGAPRGELSQLRPNDGELGAGLRSVEPQQDLPAVHVVAVFHVDLSDYAAVTMLHLLDVAIDDYRRRGDYGAG